MGLDELIGRLERDADARVAAEEARARAEVQAVTAAADQVSTHARDEALARRRAQRRARFGREVAATTQVARADGLRAEYALFDRVMGRTAALLDGMERDDEYLSTLPARLTEALRFVDERAARVRCRPALAAAVRAAIAGRGDLTVEEVPMMAVGFSVVARDGSVEVEDTLSARLEQLRPRLLIDLLAEADR